MRYNQISLFVIEIKLMIMILCSLDVANSLWIRSTLFLMNIAYI